MKSYKKPVLNVERFTPNEFVAACHDWNTVYKFKCDAGWTVLTGSTVYTNGKDGIMDTADDVNLGAYHKCTATHEASTKDDFIEGYLRKNILGFPAGEPQKVIIWRGENGDNVHCTTKLDMSTWETDKS